MITNEGIKAISKKIDSLLQLRSPRTVKEVQALKGKLVALGCFLVKLIGEDASFQQNLKDSIR